MKKIEIELSDLIGGYIETWYGDFDKLTLVIIHTPLSNFLRLESHRFYFHLFSLEQIICKTELEGRKEIKQLDEFVELFQDENEILEISFENLLLNLNYEQFDFFSKQEIFKVQVRCSKCEIYQQ